MRRPLITRDPNPEDRGGSEAQDQPKNVQPQDDQPKQDETLDQQPSLYRDVAQKKGFQTPDDLAKSYQEAEQNLGRLNTSRDTTKKQLEQHGYTIDDNGNVVPFNNQNVQPSGGQSFDNQYQPYGQQPNGSQEQVYDPYTGQLISNPVDAQLAQLPLSQRTAVVVNAIIAQREKMQASSMTVEKEVLSKPEAKGFEDDVRNVMAQLPLEQRQDKKSWEDALLKVKGMRYDAALKNAGQQGVDQFLNKESKQQIPGAGGSGDNVKLTPAQERTYQWYKDNKPEMFKDKKSFLNATVPTGGR